MGGSSRGVPVPRTARVGSGDLGRALSFPLATLPADAPPAAAPALPTAGRAAPAVESAFSVISSGLLEAVIKLL